MPFVAQPDRFVGLLELRRLRRATSVEEILCRDIPLRLLDQEFGEESRV
jgi:hypothetical protein